MGAEGLFVVVSTGMRDLKFGKTSGAIRRASLFPAAFRFRAGSGVENPVVRVGGPEWRIETVPEIMPEACPMTKTEQVNRTDVLRRLPLFAPLSDAERERLTMACRVRSFARGETLLHEGTAADGMYVVLSGVVKVVRFGSDGKETILHLVRNGNTLGEAAVFQQGTFPASALAVDQVSALHVPADILICLVRENPDLALRMLAALSLRLRMFSHKLAAQGQVDAARRLALYLLHRSQLDGGNPVIRLDVSREVLGNLLGLARETLSRQLSRFAELGVVGLNGREIMIRDREGLRRLAEEGTSRISG